MGARNNIVVHQSSGDPIWLYGHWAGNALHSVVQKAIARRQRWNDESYFTRILISEFCRFIGLDQETGGGITVFETDQDSEYTPIHVYPDTNTVVVGTMEYTFEEFCDLELEE